MGRSDRIKVLIIAVACLITSAMVCPSYGQEVSVRLSDAPISTFLHLLEEQSGYVVILIQPVFQDHPKITVDVDHQPLEKLLQQVLTPLGAEFVFTEKNIVIRQARSFAPKRAGRRVVNGRIIDTLGNSIQGATVQI